MKLLLGRQPNRGSNIQKQLRRPNVPVVATSSAMQNKILLGVAALLVLASPSRAQVGSNICSCSPQTYEFTLDFSLSCDDIQLSGPGISEFECVIAPFQTGADIDLVPASVETVDFVEFDQALGRLAESSIFEQLLDGATISYTSVSADPETITVSTVPKALQITMLAQNSIGQPILMTWLMTFSNSCNEYPVISSGERIGWTRFTEFTEPDSSLCPIVNGFPPTRAPSSPATTSYPTYIEHYPTYAPIGPCRPSSSSPKGMMSSVSAKGKGKGGQSNIFYDGYYAYYTKGKGSNKSSMGMMGGGKMSKSSSSKKGKGSDHHHYYPMKGGRLRNLKMKKSHKHYYPSHQYWYSNGYGKGKGYYLFDRNDDEHQGEDDDDLPICPPPRPPPPRPRPKRPSPPSASHKSADSPAYSPTIGDDDESIANRPNMAPTRAPNSTPTTASGSSPIQQSQENYDDTLGRQQDPDEPIVASWGVEEDSNEGLGVRAALFAGAGVAAGLIAVIATYIYRREKKFVAKEVALQQQQQSRGRLGARPRQPRLPLVKTMSATVATESEMAAMARP